jgi:hypothetical protein
VPSEDIPNADIRFGRNWLQGVPTTDGDSTTAEKKRKREQGRSKFEMRIGKKY